MFPLEIRNQARERRNAKLSLFTNEAGFDAAYVKDNVAAHEDTVATFKDFAANGASPR